MQSFVFIKVLNFTPHFKIAIKMLKPRFYWLYKK
jgi:hypothetical protein